MTALELLAPARNKDIGIAAIDCGADAVYIAGPAFGARKAAGNSIDDIRELCDYAHRFGVRVFVTFNISIRDDEWDQAHEMMLQAQAAGADAFIIREARITSWDDITVPLHASTQCAIRDVERARMFESLGCGRIVLERELSLETVRQICAAVSCEVEFFVHGALCVCYSGECRLSEVIDGRSADRGECIQACRSLYDLVDASGRTIVKSKALLSLKDYNLRSRLEDLAGAGVCSFKIEGRLKNVSYVRNVVRDYDLALNALVAAHPDLYCRSSYGRVTGGFVPDTTKTFNRGYTELYLDGIRSRWSSMDAPKSMGEEVGEIVAIKPLDHGNIQLTIKPRRPGIVLRNGDGFAFSSRDGVTGFRGDVCSDRQIVCKDIPALRKGIRLFRNINTAFEKVLDTQLCHREIPVDLKVRVSGSYNMEMDATSADGRHVISSFNMDLETADNGERAAAMLREQLSKRSGHYNLTLSSLDIQTPGGRLPLLSASTINSMRRLVAQDIDSQPCVPAPMYSGQRNWQGPVPVETRSMSPLMRTRYCIRFELGMCPVHQGAAPSGDLFIVNNGRRFALRFDCKACEMTLHQS